MDILDYIKMMKQRAALTGYDKESADSLDLKKRYTWNIGYLKRSNAVVIYPSWLPTCFFPCLRTINTWKVDPSTAIYIYLKRHLLFEIKFAWRKR